MSDHGDKHGGDNKGADAHGGGGHGGHKKKHHHHKHEEHEHEEGWIVSFADNVLLQMGFFVILLAMNMGPKGASAAASSDGDTPSDRMLDLAIAVREAFHNPVRVDSTDPNDAPLIRRLRDRQTQGDTSNPGADGEQRKVETVRPSDWVGKDGFVEFSDASSEISDKARTTIKQISEQIVGTKWMVEIRGHVSKLEGFRDVAKSRELSYQRAFAVAQELVGVGVKWEQIAIVAMGDAAPVQPRARSTNDHAANQRVEMIITPQTMPPDPYSEEPEK